MMKDFEDMYFISKLIMKSVVNKKIEWNEYNLVQINAKRSIFFKTKYYAMLTKYFFFILFLSYEHYVPYFEVT